MFATLVALAVLAPSAFAAVSITSPVATTSWQAGQGVTINWQDDGQAPALKDFGHSAVGIFVGGTTTEAEVFHIADNVDVSTTAQINWTVDGSFGPSANFYFVRFTSNSCTTTAGSLVQPCEAFSAKFALTNMNGNFNSTVQQIAQEGSSSASAPAGSSSASGAPTGNPAATTPSATGSTSHASSPSGTSHSSSASTSAKPTGAAASANGASGLFTSAGLVAAVASVVGSFML